MQLTVTPYAWGKVYEAAIKDVPAAVLIHIRSVVTPVVNNEVREVIRPLVWALGDDVNV